jgi:hypothetical protein
MIEVSSLLAIAAAENVLSLAAKWVDYHNLQGPHEALGHGQTGGRITRPETL